MKKLPSKQIAHRSYENFNGTKFCQDLDQELLRGEMYSHDINSYSTLTEIFLNTLKKHAPLKFKTIRGNQVPFMTKKLSKAIINKSRQRNKYLKWPSRENFLAYKKAKINVIP